MSDALVGDGLRFEIRLIAAAEGGASYELELTRGAEATRGQARISAAGAVAFDWANAAAPAEWCVTVVRAQLRALWRERAASGVYPRRLTRWRPAPSAVSGREGVPATKDE